MLELELVRVEQTIMPDVLFETMITAGLVVLLWRPGPWPMATGALVLGAAVTVREIGGVLIVPVVVFAALTARGCRQKAGRAGLAAGCFVLPVLAYLAGTFLVTGHFGMAGNGPSPPVLRHAEGAGRPAGAVPVTGADAGAGRHRRAAAQPALARAHRAGAARADP